MYISVLINDTVSLDIEQIYTTHPCGNPDYDSTGPLSSFRSVSISNVLFGSSESVSTDETLTGSSYTNNRHISVTPTSVTSHFSSFLQIYAGLNIKNIETTNVEPTIMPTSAIQTDPSDKISTLATLSNFEYSTLNSITESKDTSNLCLCGCNAQSIENISIRLLQIKNNLTIEKEKLTLYKRRYISVADPRLSAGTMGYVAAVVLISVPVLMILSDISNVYGRKHL